MLVGREGQKTSKLVGGKIQAVKVAAGEIGAPANSKIVIDFSDKINCLQQELQQLSEKKSEKEELKEKIELMLIKLKTREATPELEGHCKKNDQYH